MDTSTFLTDTEKAAVVAFVANPTAFDAVKKVLLFGIYSMGTMEPGKTADPKFNWALKVANDNPGAVNNEMIGQQIRAVAEGLNFLETAYNKLTQFTADVEKKDTPPNPAL